MAPAPSTLLSLSEDELLRVYDFAPSPALSMTCQWLWDMMRHRYKTLTLFPEYVPVQMQRTLCYREYIRTLHVRCRPTASIAFDHLGALHFMTRLEVLTLDLTRQGLSGTSLNFLSSLDCLRLTSLAIWISSNKLPAIATQPLAKLAQMETLQSVSLHMMDNKVGDVGAKALSALAQLPNLSVLRLDLESNGITRKGAEELAKLGEAKKLHSLELTLSHNRIGDDGASELSVVLSNPTLARLVLKLDGCNVGDNGVSQLATMAEQRPFVSLRLSLQYGCATDAGAYELARVVQNERLQFLEFRLSGNQISPDGVAVLQKCVKCWDGKGKRAVITGHQLTPLK
eukprot:EG_transcript_11616